MTSPFYRHKARQYLEAAEAKMSSGQEEDLLDAALRLRMAMEALTYERAKIYKDDLGPHGMETWQPRRLMQRMLEIDPQADASGDLHMGAEPSFGEKPETMRFMGRDNVLNLKTLKKHYDALGSYLHVPTISKWTASRGHDFAKLRSRCDALVEAMHVVLSSSVWNVDFKQSGSTDCSNCNAPMRRRLSHDGKTRKVECWECGMTYDLQDLGDGKVMFDPRQAAVPCISESCDTINYVAEGEWVPGFGYACRKCGQSHRLAMGVTSGEIPESSGSNDTKHEDVSTSRDPDGSG